MSGLEIYLDTITALRARIHARTHARTYVRTYILGSNRSSTTSERARFETTGAPSAPRAMNMHLIGVAVPNLEGFEVRAQFNEKQTLNLVSPTEIDRHNLARPRTYRR